MKTNSHNNKFDNNKKFNSVIVFADGTTFWGNGVGSQGSAVGEICFNTSLTGYQEIISDPSYAGQIITFTFPHIGNVGGNESDVESQHPSARGIILRSDITSPSNWRSKYHLEQWLIKHKIIGITSIDTRAITTYIRDKGAKNASIFYNQKKSADISQLAEQAKEWPGLLGMDLASKVTCKSIYEWKSKIDNNFHDKKIHSKNRYKVVAIDYGCKKNILNLLEKEGCTITVVPATTSAEKILSFKPNGIFLSNGPGDPKSTGEYAIPIIKELIKSKLPIFGICLGHQLLALALGAKTQKMHMGHRGANQPVKNNVNGKVEITSQNHGFVVNRKSLPKNIIETHTSLFDGVIQGIRVKNKPIFGVQFHPEASPGPQDTHYLFKLFRNFMSK